MNFEIIPSSKRVKWLTAMDDDPNARPKKDDLKAKDHLFRYSSVRCRLNN